MLSIALLTMSLVAPNFAQSAVEPAPAPAKERLAVGRRVGELHPDLELPTIDGARTLRLSELRGTKLLLIEFASW